MAEAKNTRSSRDSGTHDKQSRSQPWRPVRKLEAPPAPPDSCIGGFERACLEIWMQQMSAVGCEKAGN